MKELKTVADFKKLAQVGITIFSKYYNPIVRAGENGQPSIIYKEPETLESVIMKVQTTQIAIERTKTTGEKYLSYLKFPKKSEVDFENNEMTIYGDWKKGDNDRGEEFKRVKILTYWFQ